MHALITFCRPSLSWKSNYDEADNNFLHRVIARRTGIPIGLSVL